MKKKRLLKGIIAASLAISIVFAVTGCEKKTVSNNTIKISGSTSVSPLMEKEAEFYKKSNKDLDIEIQAIGSSAGIQDTINGVSHIGMSSRNIKEEEKSSGLDEKIIAYDGIVIITNNKNSINNLSLEQLKEIYTGKITNWKELGGEDKPIVVVSREDGSGTRTSFQEIVDFKPEEQIENAIITDGNGSIKNIVKSNENAIGYISFEYIDDTIKPQHIDGVEPTEENVLKNTYKLSRPFIVIYKEENFTQEDKKFLDFILSEDGQNIVKSSGAIRINP
ncbi:phosphate ABC transporter substrate-binding protein [Clostridium senegalense]|uniref:phosphate ABC transporter substrate-binding protein n=1 Tax=Clostridium senegalense TaxID=1465809 RepID=UPI000287A476|nr:phosphate ABC transporter substrate-binding protein [Clostridium senegalense]